MVDLLHGRMFLWASWDHSGVVTAALRTMLIDALGGHAVRLRLLKANSCENLAQIVSAQGIGLALWTMHDDADLPDVANAVMLVRSKPNGPVCVCFVESHMLDCTPILVEAGAQIVVGELPSLQRVLPRILEAAPFSPHGYHPLTSGLVERLPWGNA